MLVNYSDSDNEHPVAKKRNLGILVDPTPYSEISKLQEIKELQIFD